MALIIGDNPVNPAVRCVTSSKLPVCDDAKLPIFEVLGMSNTVTNDPIVQNTFERITFSTNPQAVNLQGDAAASEFVVVRAGNYDIFYDLAVASEEASGLVNSFIAITAASTGAAGNPSVPVRGGQAIKAPVSTTIANVSSSTIIPLAVGDRIGLYVSADSAAGGSVTLTAVGRLTVHSLIGNFS